MFLKPIVVIFMDDKQIQRQLLEILNDFNAENPEYYLARGYLVDKLKIDDKTLEKNVLYLNKEKYVDIARSIGLSFNSVKITDKGIDLVESPELFNSMFPTDDAAPIIQKSQKVVTASDDVNLSIENSFNEIYNTIESLNLENKDEIWQKVSIIREELKKDKISKSKIRNSTKWLKMNARWTIFPLSQIIIMSYGLA